MNYSCIAVDDEYPATQIIESFVKKIPELELIKSFNKADEALIFLNNNEIDILFLDIQMPELNGLEFIQSLRRKTKVIFTTAYDKYALDGFQLEVIDYLLKPFSFDRFAKATNKAITQIELERGAQIEKSKEKNQGFITVKSDYKLHKVSFQDIDYIEGLKAYISIFVKGKRLIVLESLKNLEESLPSDQFIRIHKSFIVPINKINLMEGNLLDIGSKKVPIGKSYKEELLAKVFNLK
jgi:DNA-binding LytR/AlgR family response regulator